MKKKQRECQLAKELKNEKQKQAEFRPQWRVFMHSCTELVEMEAREKQQKEKEKVDAVKRKLQFEQTQREEVKKKKEKEQKKEREARKQTTPRKHNVEVVSLFSSDDEPAVKKGRIYIYVQFLLNVCPAWKY